MALSGRLGGGEGGEEGVDALEKVDEVVGGWWLLVWCFIVLLFCCFVV